MKTMTGRERWRIPPLGMRIVKTSVAVFLCYMIYTLRGKTGMPNNSAVTAIICMQSSVGGTRTKAINRLWSTGIGGFYGLLVLLVLQRLGSIPQGVLYYFLVSIGVLLVLYTGVCLGKPDAAPLAPIVFLIITVAYTGMENPFTLVFYRVLDTLIGIGVSLLVNEFHLPRERHGEKLFLVNADEIFPPEGEKLTTKFQIEMNRLIEEGARIVWVTRHEPVFLIEQLHFLKLDLPAIVLDGAALYDMKNNYYLEKKVIANEHVRGLENFFKSRGISYQVVSIRDNTLLTYYEAFHNEAEEREYQSMSRSPYQNYIHGTWHEDDEIVCLKVTGAKSEIEELEKAWLKHELSSVFRVSRKEYSGNKDYKTIYFYDIRATMEYMEGKMLSYTKTETVVSIGAKDFEQNRKWKANKPEYLSKVISKHYEPLRRP